MGDLKYRREQKHRRRVGGEPLSLVRLLNWEILLRLFNIVNINAVVNQIGAVGRGDDFAPFLYLLGNGSV